jgi:hypothetical protein
MKYVFVRESDGAEFPFLFCAPITHREAATMLQGQRHGRTIASAGFVEWRSPHDPRCFGASDSLGLVSRPEHDSTYLAAFTRATLDTAYAGISRRENAGHIPAGQQAGTGPATYGQPATTPAT